MNTTLLAALSLQMILLALVLLVGLVFVILLFNFFTIFIRAGSPAPTWA
jgi:hypothetical protein